VDTRVVYNLIKPDKDNDITLVFLYRTYKISQLVQKSGLNQFGVIYMVDENTNFIIHPLDETRSLLQLGQDYNDKTLVRLCNDIINGNLLSGNYRHTNTVTKIKCSEALYKIDRTGWLLGVSIYNGDSIESPQYHTLIRGIFINFILWSGVFAIILVFLVHNRIRQKNFIYFCFPVVLLAVMLFIIMIYNRYPQQSSIKNINANRFLSFNDKSDEQMLEKTFFKWDLKNIISDRNLDDFITNYQKTTETLYGAKAKMIPTGVFLNEADFTDSYKIKVKGIVWQKFLLPDYDYPQEILERYENDDFDKKGVYFPNAFTGYSDQSLQLTYVVDTMLDAYPALVYRWNFEIETVEQLSPVLFPFGKNEITLDIWSVDLDSGVILIPDLEGYIQLYPTDKPGLGNNFHLKKWNIMGTYYSFTMASFLTNWGNMQMHGINEYPELIYNISISRKFIDVLIGRIIPLLIVLGLLFTMIIVRGTTDSFNNIVGCSGLFFVLILDHINLRESVSSESIMFFEFFYFISYFMILCTAVSSLQFERNGLSYNEKIDSILKKSFWIFILGVLTAVTAVYFR
jgi:hypothetical protein